MNTLKKNLFGYITIAICAGIMVYFVSATGGFGELWKLITESRLRWIFAALAAAVMVWMMEAASFHTISTHIYRGWRFSYSFSSAMVGLLYCAITPFSTGGQPMQIYSLHKKGMTTGAASAIVAVRSLVYQVALVVFSLVMIVLRLSYFADNVTGFTVLLLIGLACNLVYVSFLIILMISPKTTDKIVQWGVRLFAALRLCRDPEGRYDKIHAQLALFHQNITLLGRSVKMYALSFVFSFAQFVFQCLIPYFLYVAVFYDKTIFVKEDILTVMAAQAFVLMVSYFIPTPGAAGGAEVSYMGFFGTFYQKILVAANEAGRLTDANGLPLSPEAVTDRVASSLTGSMFLWRFISFYLTIIAGGIFVPLSDRQKRLELENRLFDEEALREAESHHEEALVKKREK